MNKTLYTLFALLLVSCEAPPAWEPGNSALRIWTVDDKTWEAISVACDRWGVVGVECLRSTNRSNTNVHVLLRDVPIGRAEAYADGTPGWDLLWHYEIHFEPQLFDKPLEYVYGLATHEFGHLLGSWGHVAEGPAVMTATPSSDVPTTIDLDSLPFEF
jgi:hypothetical protein